MAARVGSLFTELTVDASGLVVGLGRAGASFDAFERSSNTKLGRIDAKFSSAFGRMGAAAKQSFGGFSAGLAAPLAGLLSVTAAINGTRAALDKFGGIADAAGAAGMDAEFFQGIAYQAKLAGVEVNAIGGALASFAKNSGLAAEGKGKLVTALQALDPILLRNIQSAATQEERFKHVANAIRDAGNEARAAAIAAAAFGDVGPKMVAAFRGGADEIDAMQQKARDLGIIIDRNVIANADALGDEFDTVVEIVDNQLKSALIALGPVLVGVLGQVADIAREIKEVVGVLQNPDDWIPWLAGTTGTESRMKKMLTGLRSELGNTSTPALGYVPGMPLVGAQPAMPSPRNETGAGALQRDLEAIFGVRMAASQAREEVKLLHDDVGAGAGNFGAMLGEFAPDREQSTGGRSRDGAADAAKRQAEAVRALVENLKFEGLQLQRNAGDQELYNTLKSVGVSRESEFGQVIESTLRPLQAQRDEIERNAEAMEALGQIGQTALDGIVDALSDGNLEASELNDILQDITKMMLKQGLSMIFGGIGKALTGGFGGIGFAEGGLVTGPGSSTSDSIPVRLSDGEFVVRAAAARQHRALLEAMNAGSLAAFADGGFVGRSASIVAPTLSGGSGDLQVRIINEGGQPMEATSASRKNEGGVDIVDIVMQAWGRGMGEGRGDGLMNAMFGVQRQAGGR